MPATDVVKKAIVAFADDWIDGTRGDADLWALFDHPGNKRVSDLADIQRIRQQNGRLQQTQLGDLYQADRFAKAIEDGRRRWHFEPEKVSPMRQNGSDTRTHWPHASNQRSLSSHQADMTDEHACDINETVGWPW
ncbi:hypothetical protein KDH_66150 [Dictyobacter sp. S3.2.2.5]|uniref:Uncharacterized protein n=1 Tax=Dictyobacter halimunensis TaxID=3026934 RepID=A0ABQ6G4P1_9CHLR|nr:hypothetical protein KDH_66150 [Dictyobacter sp. S3.2.2.5]